MGTVQLGEVIAEREFDVHDADGKVSHAILRMGKPQQKAPNDWYCPFQITGIGDEKVDAGPGIDSLHALLMGLQMARMFLGYFAKHERKKVTWLDSDDLGFSIKSSR